jgi:hypothetical protein
MATGRENQLTKAAGEYLVCAELCRRHFVATTFTGNIPDFDILTANSRNKSFPIQVKTIKGGDWQLNADKYLEISISNGIQRIKGKRKIFNGNLIHVFIKLVEQGKDEFYILNLRDLQKIIFNNYSAWLRIHKGRRPRNPESKHVSVSVSDLEVFKGKWNLLGKS